MAFGFKNNIGFFVKKPWMVALALAVALVVFGNVQQSFAQSSACLRLQNQLSALNSGGGNRARPSARYRQYDRAVKDQRAQITKTRRMARRNGCSIRVPGRRNSSSCGRINASLNQMQGNLKNLEQQRRRLAPRGSGSNRNNRRQLIRTMNQRGCINNGGQERPQFANARPGTRSLVEQIFGVRTFGNDGRRSDFERPNAAFSSRYNTFRTMCVRKKDGYYFPVSFSTVPERFESDESACQSKCPGTDVALYYHAIPAQDSEDMISFRGNIPYTDLPTAFAYRKKFDPEATCRYTSGILQEIAGAEGETNTLREEFVSVSTRIGTPIFRSDRALDPETISNQNGSFDTVAIARLFNKEDDPTDAQIVASSGQNIRVVGPAFFPVQ